MFKKLLLIVIYLLLILIITFPIWIFPFDDLRFLLFDKYPLVIWGGLLFLSLIFIALICHLSPQLKGLPYWRGFLFIGFAWFSYAMLLLSWIVLLPFYMSTFFLIFASLLVILFFLSPNKGGFRIFRNILLSISVLIFLSVGSIFMVNKFYLGKFEVNLKKLKSPEYSTRYAAVRRLYGNKQAIPYLIEDLKQESNEHVFFEITKSLSKLGESPIPILDEILQNKNEDTVAVCMNAVRVLGYLSERNSDKSIIPLLIQSIMDKNDKWGIRYIAMDSLPRSPIVDEYIVPFVTRALMDKTNEEVREFAIKTLCYVSASRPIADKSLVPFLIEILKEESDSYIFKQISQTLNYLGEPQVPILVEILQDKTKDREIYRNNAIRALGKLSQSDKSVISVLIQFLKDKTEPRDVRHLIICELASITTSIPPLPTVDKSLILVFAEALRDDDMTIRSVAEKTLRQISERKVTLNNEQLQLLRNTAQETLNEINLNK